MADEELVRILRSGIADPWNDWRGRNNGFADLSGADLHGAYLHSANLRDVHLDGADLSGADLRGANLDSAHLTGADLHGAHLREANLQLARLREADLRGALLSNANLQRAELSDADLSDADLRGADLRGADLRGADLSNANLHGASLERADLSGADLHGAYLLEANLSYADLHDADLSRAVLREALLIRVLLNNTSLEDAFFQGTVFSDVSFDSCMGLESCRHGGPSSVDTLTLQRSGRLPLAFLRGVGLPDMLIEYLPSLLNQAIQHYSCFISYSTKDDEFAHRLHADLQDKGVRCWFAPHDMKIGAKIRDTIDDAIRLRDKVMIVLSEAAIASDWVEDEVDKAFEEERQRGCVVLFPVRLDDAVLTTNEAWAAKLRRSRNIGDFRAWKDHDAYQMTFAQVLRDLRVEAADADPSNPQ